jgi:hypothetical protein
MPDKDAAVARGLIMLRNAREKVLTDPLGELYKWAVLSNRVVGYPAWDWERDATYM